MGQVANEAQTIKILQNTAGQFSLLKAFGWKGTADETESKIRSLAWSEEQKAGATLPAKAHAALPFIVGKIIEAGAQTRYELIA